MLEFVSEHSDLVMQPLHKFDLIDTHCHLDFHDFDRERSEILGHARRSGIQAVINPGVNILSSRETIKISDQFENLYVAVGVHPNEANAWDDESLESLEQLAVHEKVVAIGEIGLDYYRDRTPRQVQIKALERQLDLARKYNLPVIIHNREANQDILDILESWHASLVRLGSPLANQPGVLHSFSADQNTAERSILVNFYLGITGPVTFPNAKELRELISEIPLDNLLLETDSPFLAPQPKRGKRNEPAFLVFIAQKVAEVKNVSLDSVARITTANARRLFKIGEKTLA